MKWVFIVFCVYLFSLCFRQENIPATWATKLISAYIPDNLVMHVDTVSVGFRHGLYIQGIKIYNRNRIENTQPLASARSISIFHLRRRLEIEELNIARLHDEYYTPYYTDHNSRIDVVLPSIPDFDIVLNHPNILGANPKQFIADVHIKRNKISLERAAIKWENPSFGELMVYGNCVLDFDEQLVKGEVSGKVHPVIVRPLLQNLDIPTILKYFDNFSEVPEAVPTTCSWNINLINYDFNLDVGVDAKMGKYNSVTLQKLKGEIHLHGYVRENMFNFNTVIGPIETIDPKGDFANGTLTINSTNDYKHVTLVSNGTIPLANLVRIGGLSESKIGEEARGKVKCNFEFSFPASMTNNYELLNGKGSWQIKDGYIFRINGMRGLVELLAEKVPGISWFTDSTQASADYIIENGIVKSDNIYIEGSAFSIKIYGVCDLVNNSLNFIARVQFGKQDSIAGMIIHPLTWPLTKLLLEFKLTGTLDDPRWEYITVIDRMTEEKL